MMKTRFLSPTALALVSAIGLVGCGGGDSTVQATSTTMGQELMDLDESRKKGLISDKEYDKAKKAILKKYN